MGIEVTPVVEKVWKPFKRQEDFIRVPDEIFEAFYGGAAGGGKSDVITMLPIVREWYKQPNFHGIVFRRTFPELEESLLMLAKKWYPYFGAKYNDQKHTFTFPSGAVMRFSYLAKDEDARSHDTAQYHYIGFDELTHFTEFQYTYMLSRIRRASEGLPCVVRSASNPGNVGHGWVRARFVAPWRLGYKVLYHAPSKGYRIFIPSKATDNPHIMEFDPNYINRLRNLPIVEQKAKIDGDWWAYAGQVFSEFRTQKFEDEPANALHVVPWFQIPTWWPKIIAIDWGYSAATAVYWGAVSPDYRLFLYREYVQSKKQIAVWGAEVLRASQFDGNIQKVALDPSAWQNRGEDKLLWMQIQEALGDIPVHQAGNDRVGGKMAIHEILRWTPRPLRYVPAEGFKQDRYDQIYRMTGQKAADDYVKMFLPEPPESNLPKLQILDGTCPEICDILPQVVYADPDKDGKLAEDTKEFKGDDSYDAFRYMVKAWEAYTTEVNEESVRRENIAAHLHLAQTDMYSFYRRMEEQESKDGQTSDAITRRNVRRFAAIRGRRPYGAVA